MDMIVMSLITLALLIAVIVIYSAKIEGQKQACNKLLSQVDALRIEIGDLKDTAAELQMEEQTLQHRLASLNLGADGVENGPAERANKQPTPAGSPGRE